jgi:tetratricopeptide (TPR) repeat protein
VTTVAPKSLRQLALDALAQAQIQWAEGARQSAIDLVKATLMRLEQSAPGDSATLATLTRDYVRMVLAQGQTQEALATLERLEPHLAGVADIWALRGNAAQRLGRHAQAISAYSKAMALRPDEARWMLGAAVSMAASGQIGPAGDLAEKVRLAGALPPDVASYLRQLGVVIRTP